jgi:hypothetical protein|tara:strand:- start:910 stop:1506 length:597 start_codon:yes stop_codon:yes gene_type:complete
MKKSYIAIFTLLLIHCSDSTTGPSNTQLPLIEDYQLEVAEDSQLTSSFPKTNNSSRGLTYNIDSEPTNGQLNISAGNFTYIPNLNFFGIDSFTYSISNNDESTDSGTVTINVLPVNDAPTVENVDFFITSGDNLLILTGNDIDNDNLYFTIVRFPTSGSLDLDINQVTYNGPAGTFFDYVANDGTVDSNKGRVSIISQ